MKFNLSIILLVAGCTLLIDACQINGAAQEEPEPLFTLHAQVENSVPDTKVSVSVLGDYGFQKNDAIGVFDSEGSVHRFTTTEMGNSVEFSVSGDVPVVPGEYAVSPYGENASATGNSVSFELPSEYTYSEWQTNMPMLGTINGDNVSFKAVGGTLMLSVYSVPVGATEMTFTATSDKVCGLFTIPDASVNGVQIEMIESEEADKTITFHFTRHSNMVFYIPLPVGTLGGFTISFNDLSHTSRTVTNDIHISRNSTIIAPSLNLGSSDVWEQHPYVTPENRISEIVWKGMYTSNDTTHYVFTYYEDSKLKSMDMGGGIVNTCEYLANGNIDIFTTDLGDIQLSLYGNTGWITYDDHPNENGPAMGYNFDGTLSRVWDHGLRKPGSADCEWDSAHNLRSVCGEQTIDYDTEKLNKWCGVSINAFLFSRPPGFPLINDYIANMHTVNVPSSATVNTQTVTFSINYDEEGRICYGELTGGWRNGEKFYVKYNGVYTGSGPNPPF